MKSCPLQPGRTLSNILRFFCFIGRAFLELNILFCVLFTTYYCDSSSRVTCWYTWLRSILENTCAILRVGIPCHTCTCTVLKNDKKSVRVCGDLKQVVNPVSHLEWYPISKVEDLFTLLSGGNRFQNLIGNEAIKFFVDQLLVGIRDRASLSKVRCSIWVQQNSGLVAL